jgi:DNA-binding transcriptional ArsR family regulator
MCYKYHMSVATEEIAEVEIGEQDVWRALANPNRRLLLDQLRDGPKTTGELADVVPELSRFAVMQHLGVLTDAGLVVVRRRGRYRFNYLNPVPLRSWYERWVIPMADGAAAEVLALRDRVEQPQGGSSMAIKADEIRTVRIETELRFHASPERVFRALTEETLEWFPMTYGEDRVRSVVVEPRVGGAHYEDWGDGMGHLYGHVTVFDRPYRYSTRGRIMAGTILDTQYELEEDDDETILRMSKVAVGPMSQDEADSIETYGDIARFEEPLRRLIEGS